MSSNQNDPAMQKVLATLAVLVSREWDAAEEYAARFRDIWTLVVGTPPEENASLEVITKLIEKQKAGHAALEKLVESLRSELREQAAELAAVDEPLKLLDMPFSERAVARNKAIKRLLDVESAGRTLLVEARTGSLADQERAFKELGRVLGRQ